MSEITRNQAIQIVEDIRTAISAGSVTNTMEAQVLEYCVSVLGRRIVEASLSGHIENLPDVAAFLAGISPSATLKALLEGITDAVEVINANIGNGYVYAGIATPSGTPVSGKVFYLAKQAGQYANFGGLTVTEGVNILKRNGSTWTQEQLLSMADIRKNPLIGYYECDTAGDTSAKTVTAAGYVLPATGGSVKIKMANRNTVANATLNINSTGAKPLYYNGRRAGVGNTWDTNEIIEVFYDGAKYQAYNVAGSNGDGVFDISVHNPANGLPTPYPDLKTALGTDGEHVPQSLRKGGMSVKFIQSSDNKYVQYRLMADSWSANTDDWSFYGGDVYVENPEWIHAVIDKEKRILEARRPDGTKYLPLGIETDGVIEGKTTDAPFLETYIDKDGRVLSFRENDGKVTIKTDYKFDRIVEFTNAVKLSGSIELTDDIVRYVLSKNINDGSIGALYPKYNWEGYIANLATTKNLGAYNDRTYKPLVLLHFSDIHNDANGFKRVLEFNEMYKEYIADILLSGDVAGKDWQSYSQAMTNLEGYYDVLKVIGNHDVYNYNNQGVNANAAQCFARYMQGIENWGAHYTNDVCYWYKDYVGATGTKDNFNGSPFDTGATYTQGALVTYNNKYYKAKGTLAAGEFNTNNWVEITSFGVRLIGYDFMHCSWDINDAQNTWLTNTLNDAITKGLSVIITTHGAPVLDNDTAEYFDTPFDGKEWLPKNYTGMTPFTVAEIVSNFIDNGGEFICYLSGHIHTDKCGCIKPYTFAYDGISHVNKHKQVFISIGLASNTGVKYDYEGTGQSEIDIQKVTGTKTSDLFNVESFDIETKTISVLRIGCDIDRLLRSRRSMVIDYKNCELLYSR